MKKLEIPVENNDECDESKPLNKPNGLNNSNPKNGINKTNTLKKSNTNNTLKKNQPPEGKVGGSSTNDICEDYIEFISNIGDIISEIDVILKSKDEIVVENECMVSEIIFDKFQTSKSSFEQVNEKLKKDQRVSRLLGNGSLLAPKNGTRNKVN